MYFNPRPTYVRRPPYLDEPVSRLSDFNPRPTYVRRRLKMTSNTIRERNFNPRPTYVRRPKCLNCFLIYQLFQSSPHVCEATYQRYLRSNCNAEFQSSPHVCEATNTLEYIPMTFEISILAPRM